jgi:hypothetical protein
MSPTTAPGAGSPTSASDYAAQYAQYYGAAGGADPYAAYGKLRSRAIGLQRSNII